MLKQFQKIRVVVGLAAVLLVASAHVRASGPASNLETVQFHSTLVGRTLPYNVILPRDYRAARVRRYPVLYLLHGFGGHYSDWVTRTNVADYASAYRMIIVMPEGNDGWYTDSATLQNEKYESYFLNELIPDVQMRYRTIESRYGRGIAGVSMGGYGALKFGLKFPGTFAFAGSLSAALAPDWSDDFLKKTSRPLRDSTLSVFGPIGSETRKANDVLQLAQDLSPARAAMLPYFYFDCGTEDMYFSDSSRLAAVLREKKIPHEFRELPGDHGWVYWNQQVREVLKIAAAKLNAEAR